MANYIRQVRARLILGTDEVLDDDLKTYAERVQLNDVIRLALYRHFGHAIPAELAALAREFGDGSEIDATMVDALKKELDDLRAQLDTQAQEVQHQLDVLRAEVADLRVHGNVPIPAAPKTVIADGDMSPREKELSAKLKKISFGSLQH
jgi:hypothetical protein